MMNVIGNYIGKQHGLTASAIASAYLATVEADGGVVEAVDCLTARIENLKTLGLWDKASAVWLPHGYKESKLYAVKGGANADLTLTRNGTRTRKGPTYVEQVPYNLWQYSESLATLPWGTANATIQSNTIAAPDGSITADKLQGNTTLGTHYLNQNISITEGIVSIHAKASELTKIELFSLSASNKGTGFDLVTGVVFSVTGHSPHSSSGIENVGDGWFRCWVYDLSWTSCRINLLNAAGEYSFAGANTTDGVYLWGAHANAGSVLKSYFKTTDRFNVPALDYTNDTCPALSVEPARTNLLVQSEDFNTTWVKGNTTVTVNSTVAPDGLSTADAVLETVTVGSHSVGLGITKAASAITYAWSLYVKPNGRDWVALQLVTGGNFYEQYFNVTTGGKGTSVGGGFTFVSSEINSVGNGWYRCVLVVTSDATTSINAFAYTSTTDGVKSHTGDITKGLYLWGAQLEAGSYATSYIPTTTATVSRIADAINVLHPEKTNLLLQSQTFDNSSWTKGSSTITSNTILAPDGTTTADTMFETIASSTHYVLQAVNVVAENQYSLSVYLKYNGRQWATVSCSNTANTNVWFDILNGVTGTAQSNVISSSITDVGDGWYRCQISFIATTSGSSGNAIFASRTADNLEAVFIGDVTKGLYLWGAQLEAGSTATTYLPTTTVPIHDGSVIGQTEGTLYFEGGTYGTGDAAHENFFSISDGTSNNRIEVLFRSTDVFQCVVTSGGVLVADITGGTVVSGQSNKIVVTYGPDGVKLVVNGVKIGEDLVVVIPATSVLRTANRYDGGTPFYGFETGRAISTTAMTEAQAIALTTP